MKAALVGCQDREKLSDAEMRTIYERLALVKI